MKEPTVDDVTGSGRGVGVGGDAPDRRRRVLFFMRGNELDAGFGRLASAMLERDRDVALALDQHRTGSELSGFTKRHSGFEQLRIHPRRGLWRIPAGATRRGLDYLRCLEPEQANADELRDLARERSPRLLRALLHLPPFRWRFGRRMLGRLMGRLEAGMPIARSTKALIRERSPDVIVVSQGIVLDSPEADLIRSAQATRTPSVLVMSGSADGDPAQIRDLPTLAVVAAQDQVNDVVAAHGLPRDRVQAVGDEVSRGTRLPSPPGVADAVDHAATERISGPRGRLLRPLLWLLTPLLVLTLLLLHPVAISKDGVSAIRRAGRQLRTRRRKAAKGRASKRKAVARSAAQQKQADSEAAGRRKAARAQEKQRKREHRSATREQSKAARQKERAQAGTETEEARTDS